MRGVARFQTGDVAGADADLDAARAASAAWPSADGITDVDLSQLSTFPSSSTPSSWTR
jgi:hypothetical protein